MNRHQRTNSLYRRRHLDLIFLIMVNNESQAKKSLLINPGYSQVKCSTITAITKVYRKYTRRCYKQISILHLSRNSSGPSTVILYHS